MSVVGEKPKGGMRLTLERPRFDAPPWIYDGAVETADRRDEIRVTVTEAGVVTIAGAGEGTAAAALSAEDTERVRLLVRTAYRQAKADGEPPARRIVRWRPSGDSSP